MQGPKYPFRNNVLSDFGQGNLVNSCDLEVEN